METDFSVFAVAQRIALQVDSTLTGDQLDRIGNIVTDASENTLDKVEPKMITRAIQRVKTHISEK